MRGLRSALVQHSAAAFATRVAGTALSFTSSVFMARALGTEEYGIFVFWLAAAATAGVFLSAGTSSVVTNQIARARGQEDSTTISRVLLYGYGATSISSLLLLLIGLGIAEYCLRPSYIYLVIETPAFVAFLSAAVGYWPQLFGAILTGYERIVKSQLLSLIAPSVTTLGAIVFWSHWKSTSSVTGLWIVVIATTVAAVISWANAVPDNREIVRVHFARETLIPAMSWFRLGSLFAVNQFLVNSITQVDILVLGALSTPHETAHYQAASRVSYVTAFFFGSIAVVTAPAIARLHASQARRRLARTVQRASLLAFAGTAATAGGVFILGQSMLHLFGPDFDQAKNVTWVLIGAWLVQAFFGLNNTLLAMADGLKITTFVLAACTVLNAVLNVVLVPKWGAYGAAWASLVSTTAFTALFWLIAMRRHGFSADVISSSISLISRRTALRATAFDAVQPPK